MSPDSPDSKTISAYLNLLESKGVHKSGIYKRKHFLQYLLIRLKNKPHTRENYGKALEDALETLTNDENRHYFRGVAREFYHFWTDDLKAVALSNAAGGYSQEPFQIEVNETLDELVEKASQVTWNEKEKVPLSSYTEILAQQGAKETSIRRRLKMAKILLFVLRGYSMNSAAYHAAVEAILPLFSLKDTQQLFLKSAREFFYFWVGDAAASGRVNFQPTSHLGPDTKS